MNSMRLSRRLLCEVLLGTAICGCSDGKPVSSDADGVSTDRAESAEPNPAGKQRTGKVRIALIMKSLANEFFSTMADGAAAHALEHAADYDLIINGIPNETDLGAQVYLVEQMIAQEVDAVVVAPADSQALIPVLKRAHAAGIVLVNIDNKLDSAVLNDAKIVVPFVGPDNRSGARAVGDFLASKLTTADNVAILEGIPTSFNGQQRKLGFEDAMNAAGLKIVDSQSADWEMSIANQTAAGMLTAHPDIKAILACNDSMALGALAATKSAGRNDVMIVGFDDITAVQQAIRDKQILATADQHGDQLAVFGIELALELLKDPAAERHNKETPVNLVTAETLID